jgi:hypothetical protein
MPAVVHAQRGREAADPLRDLGRQRVQHQRGQQHDLDDPGAERQVAPGQRLCELLRADGRGRRRVHRVPGHRHEHRRQQHLLERGEPRPGHHCACDAAGEYPRFAGIGWAQVGFRW